MGSAAHDADEGAREIERQHCEVQMELAHANRVTTLGQLAASIGHEVKQPLSAITTNAKAGLRWLAAQPPNLDEARRSFEDIFKDAIRAGEVIDRIRSLVKNAPPSKAPLALDETINEVIALTQAEVLKRDVAVYARFGEKVPPIEGDRVQLQQVMLNLILNAVEAMSENDGEPRELIIGTCEDGSGGAVISVADSGPGVPSTEVYRIFQPFFTTKANGMGMGLSICRSIVEAHGGRLSVHANAPRGAVFRVILPALDSRRPMSS